MKCGEKENTGNKKKVKTARERTQRPLKKTATEGTQAPTGGKMASSGKLEEREEEEDKTWKKRKKNGSTEKRTWWKGCKELIIVLFLMRTKKDKKEREHKRSERRAQNWLSVSAGELRMQQEVRIKESRWAEATPKRWKQPKGEDRIEMKNEARVSRCTLLNGSAWSTERKYMRRCKGKCAIFFGTEHRMRKEEMEEQFNREAKQGWRCCSRYRITDATASSEDRKHTSGGVFVAVERNLGVVTGKEKERSRRSQGMNEDLPTHG